MRGINNVIKRRAIFNYYRSRGDILCLQETHSNSSVEEIWKNKWGGEAYYSHGNQNSRGLAIFCIPYHVVKTMSDLDGRIVALELESIYDPTKRFTLCNVYGPNKDRPWLLS